MNLRFASSSLAKSALTFIKGDFIVHYHIAIVWDRLNLVRMAYYQELGYYNHQFLLGLINDGLPRKSILIFFLVLPGKAPKPRVIAQMVNGKT